MTAPVPGRHSNRIARPWDCDPDHVERVPSSGSEEDDGGLRMSTDPRRRYSLEALAESDWKFQLFKGQFIRRVVLPGGHLDSMKRNIDSALDKVSLFSVLETSNPVAAALSKVMFRWLLLLGSILYTGYLIKEVTTMMAMGKVTDAAFVRFKPLMLRGGGDPDAIEPWVREFGVLKDGCKVEGLVSERELPGILLLRFSKEVDFDGYYFITELSDPDLDPISFRIEADGEDTTGDAWPRVGTSMPYLSMDGHVTFPEAAGEENGGEIGTVWPEARDVEVKVALGVPWHGWLGLQVLNLGLALATPILAALPFRGMQSYGKGVLVVMLGLVGCSLGINAALAAADSGRRQSSYLLQWCNAAALWIIGIALLFYEKMALGIWLYASLHFTVINALEDTVFYPGGRTRDWASVPVLSYISLIVSIGFLLMRQRLLWYSAHAISEDKVRYNAAWASIMARRNDYMAMVELKATAQEVQIQAQYNINGGPLLQHALVKENRQTRKASRFVLGMNRTTSVRSAGTNQYSDSGSNRHLGTDLADTPGTRGGRGRRQSQSARELRSGIDRIGSHPTPLARIGEEPRYLNSRRRSSTLGGEGFRDALRSARASFTSLTGSMRGGGALSPFATPGADDERPGGSPLAALRSPSNSGLLQRSLQESLDGGTSIASSQGIEEEPVRAPEGVSPLTRARSTSFNKPQMKRQNSIQRFQKSFKKSFRQAWRKNLPTGSMRSAGMNSNSSEESRGSLNSARLSRTGSIMVDNESYVYTKRPVTSLDQVYVLAVGVYTMLKEKVKIWAKAQDESGRSCGGCFRMVLEEPEEAHPPRRTARGQQPHTRSEFRPWHQVEGTPDEDKVRWATLKKPQRAVEKLIRSYKGKVGKLLDICRQSIVFDSIHDLHTCLKAVIDDDDVKILSIKNRLSDEYDENLSAGYRDINLNIRFETEEARSLWVEYHVCELQLLLRQFAELKTDHGHKRYVKFRNARAL